MYTLPQNSYPYNIQCCLTFFKIRFYSLTEGLACSKHYIALPSVEKHSSLIQCCWSVTRAGLECKSRHCFTQE